MANRRFIDFPIASTVGDSDIILIWQGGANKQTTKATFLSGLPENLDELNDVTISGLTNGQILRYDSVTGKWENTDQGNLDLNDLNDVSIVSPSNGQVLVYNSSTSKWENSSGGFVPYVGAVTTVDLGAQGLRAGYVRFDTTVASVPNEQGLMFWDADDETVDIILNGYTMKIGEDLFYPVKNQTGSTIAKGVAVRFAGTLGASGRLLIEPFIADGSVPSSRFMGVTAEEILNGEDGKVLYFGRVRGINTNAFNEGDILYASTTVAGGYQTAIPLPPNNIVEVAAVISKSATVGTIFVRPTLGSNINTDEGVKITSVADKNLLQYQSGTALWENKTLAQVLGGTSSQFVKGDGSLDSTSYQPLLTNPVTGTGTTNYLPKFTAGSTIGNSRIFDNATNVGINTVTPNDFIDGESGMAIVQTTNGRAVLSLVGTRTDANEVLGRISFTNSNSTNIGAKRVSYISGVRGSTNNSAFLEFGVANDALGSTQMVLSQLGNLLVGASNQSSDNGARLQVSGSATVSGNVGIGVTPSAWGSPFVVSQYPYGSYFGGTTSGGTVMGNNNYYNGSSYIYQNSDYATQYQQGSGTHFWRIAPSGTAGNAISFTQAMTLTSGGNLLVGTTTDNGARLQVSGRLNVLSTYASDSAVQSVLRDNTGVALNFGGTASGFKWLQAQDSTGASTYYNLLLNPYGGNVGIGTQIPSGLLDLKASSGATIFNLINNASSLSALVYQESGANKAFVQYLSPTFGVAARANSLEFGTIASGSFLAFRPLDVEAMRITSSGSVGIGTASPVSIGGYTALTLNNATTGGILTFQRNGTNIGSIYNTTSDITLGVNSGNATFETSGAERMRITSGGNVGIGTASPAVALEILRTAGTASYSAMVSGTVDLLVGVDAAGLPRIFTAGANAISMWTNSTERMRITAGGEVLIGNTDNGAYNLQCNGTGVWGAGAYVNGSDRNIKDNIATIEKGLEYIQKMNPVKFRYKPNYTRDHSMQTGFIAQELQEVFASEDYLSGLVQQGVHLSVAYQNLLPVLVKAIQELKQEIDTLKN